jgi:hypothetical protein
MKALGQILLLLVIVVAVAFGAGYFLLPKEAKITKTADIKRPAATLYTYLASMPKDTAFGDAKATVTETKPPTMVGLALSQADGTAPLKATFEIVPTADGAKLTLVSSKPLGANPIARLQGLMGGGAAGAQLEAGLKSVVDGANALPAADFSTLKFEIVDLAAKPYLYVDASTPTDPTSIKNGLMQAMTIVRAALTANGLKEDDKPIAIETQWDEKGKVYSFQAGQQFTGPRPSFLVGVKQGQTPAGSAIKVLYRGPEESVIPVYDQVEALIAASRLEKAGFTFERYLDDPAAPQGSAERQIFHLIKGDLTLLRSLQSPGAATPPPVVMPAPEAAPATAPVDPAAPAPAAPAPAAPQPAKPN